MSMKFNQRLKPNTEFIVYKTYQLSSDHRTILSDLYLPLIGTGAFSLYFYLHESTRDDNVLKIRFHREVIDELNTTLSELTTYLDKLEGIGLIRSYMSTEEHADRFVYRLASPLSAEKFFKDPMLSMYLFSQIGTVKFNDKKERLTYPDLPDNLTEVTKKFTDVYHQTNDHNFTVPNEQFKEENTSRGPTVDLDDFDFEVLFTHLKGTRVDKKFFTKEASRLIVQLSDLFSLNAYDLKQILLASTSPQFGIDLETLKREARKYYQKESGKSVPTFTQQEKNEEMENLSYFERLDRVSPLDRINDLRHHQVSENDLKVVTEVIVKTTLENGVINILLEYALQMKDGELPLRYVMTIAENWQKEGFRTAEEAYKSIMDFRDSQAERRKKKSYNKGNSGESEPAWLKDRAKDKISDRKIRKKQGTLKTAREDEALSDMINKFREN